MAYLVALTAAAEAEIAETVEFIERYSPDAARRWIERYERAIESLAQAPHRFPLAPEAERHNIELRVALFGKRRHTYRVLFVVDSDRSVVVVSVRHGARDYWSP